LFKNTTGENNTATGAQALYSNTTGFGNTADGNGALFSNTTGYSNTAIGTSSLESNIAGTNNVALGIDALFANTTGNFNTGTGSFALYLSTTGKNNTALGYEALQNNTTGSSNIAIGSLAGSGLTTGGNNIDIAATGVAGESNTIRLGKYGVQQTAFIQGVFGNTVPGGVAVVVDYLGRFGTVVSSMRYKDNIKPMDTASEAVLSLQPVTFRYKKDLDPKAIPQFGLVAEDVAKIDPDLVARDEEGKPYTVRYDVVNAMLLNEFLKEHKRVQTLEATVSQLEAQAEEIADLKALLAEQAETLRKVSARLEAGRPATRLAETR
jgi:hypothetical protein